MVKRSEYELIFIARPGLDAEEEVPALAAQVHEWIEGIGGEVTYSDIWGRRRLAYPIRKLREGYYVLLRAMMPRQALGDLERELKLSEDVLRYLLVRAETPPPPKRAPAPRPAPAAAPADEGEPKAEQDADEPEPAPAPEAEAAAPPEEDSEAPVEGDVEADEDAAEEPEPEAEPDEDAETAAEEETEAEE
jgi:small subunit ribosomal protein S6